MYEQNERSESAAAWAGEAYAESPADVRQAAVNSEKCPACGDNLNFDPVLGKLKCPSCGTVREIFAQGAREQSFSPRAIGDDSWAQETHVYHCNNCNAEDVLDKREIARVCPFCGSPGVVEKREFSAMRPQAILPFSVGKEQACEQAKVWAKKRLFSPRDFKTYFETEKLNGLYLPAFTFDAQSYSSYSGRLGEYYYTTVKVNGKEQRVRHTRYFPVAGDYNCAFDDIAINAGDAVPENYIKTLLYYDYTNSVEYREDFLYGFSAVLYTKDSSVCWEEAKECTRSTIRYGILGKYRHDTVDRLDIKTTFYDIKYRYLLLPMYICNYMYKGKTYSLYINGRTGKAKGAAPVSPFRVGLAAIAGIAVCAVICALVYFFG